MAIDIKYDNRRKMLNVSVSGASDLNEITLALEKITNSTEYPPNIRAVWDIRKADATYVNFQFIKEIVKIRSQFSKLDNCCAALIVSSNVQYGLSRMFQIISEDKFPHQLMIFRSYEEGEQWLLKN